MNERFNVNVRTCTYYICSSTFLVVNVIAPLPLLPPSPAQHFASACTLGVGTPDYLAPELINLSHPLEASGQAAYDPAKADVWSMGATL